MDVDPIAVRVPVAAKMLGISRSVLYELLRANAIPSFRVGTSRLVPTAALHAWVEQQSALAQEAGDGR